MATAEPFRVIDCC